MRDALRKKREELERRLNSLEASLIASHALLFINDSLDEVLSLSWEGEAAALSNSMRIAGEQGATGVIVAIRRKEAASPWDDRTREEFSQLAEFHGISLVTTIRWNLHRAGHCNAFVLVTAEGLPRSLLGSMAE